MFSKIHNDAGLMIGLVDTDSHVFEKTVSSAKHLMRKFDSYGIDYWYFNNVLLPNNYTIKIIEVDTRRTLYISAVDFDKNKIIRHYKNKDTGYDHNTQVFCPRSKFAQNPN